MRNYLIALASGWRAGKKQARKRLTELRRDAAAARLLTEVNKWDKSAAVQVEPKRAQVADVEFADNTFYTDTKVGFRMPSTSDRQPAAMPDDAVAELNAIRDLMHPDGPESRTAVFPIRGPQQDSGA